MERTHKSKVGGRQAGGHNKGYWLRAGRGWFVTDGRRSVPLRDEAGSHLTAQDTPPDVLRDAYARYRLGIAQQAKRTATGSGAIMGHVCEVYLAHSKATDKPATFVMRGGFLFDFCTGLPARFWDKGTGKEVQAPSRADYLHKGYATREVSSILPLDVQSWLDKHKGWTEGTKRIAIQAVRRAMNYAREMKLIPENPIKGIKIPKANARITYLTPEQERAIAENTYKAFAILVYVCIRTGGRPISEVCAVTAKHVEEPPHGQIWRFRPKQHKTGHQTNADRLVFLPADVAEMVRGLAKRYPSGPLFRNRSGNPWTHSAAKTAFDRVRSKLADKGIKLDPDACLYSTRHTFAKRMLGGYWGEPVTLAVLAGLMNDRPDTCFKHYAKWSEEYTSPLFKAVNGTKKIT